MAEQKLNLTQKLALIRQMCGAVKKSKKGYGYNYADITDILAKVTAGMNKYHVTLIPSIVPGTISINQNVTVNTKTTKDGNVFDSTSTEMLVKAEMIFTWVDDDNVDDVLRVPWIVTGSQNDPSQAFGSGLTYCTRYFLTTFFNIAQPDTDVDAYRSKQKEAEMAEDIALAGEIVKQLDDAVRIYLDNYKDKSEEVKKFLGKYVKGGDYRKVKEPAIASEILNSFKETFKI